jgi:hypothetical protein
MEYLVLTGEFVCRPCSNLGRQHHPILQRQQANELNRYPDGAVRGLKGGNQDPPALRHGTEELAGFRDVLCR